MKYVMKLKLHHVNLSTNNVKQMDSFYRSVFGMTTETSMGDTDREKDKGYPGDVSFVTDGNIQFHLAEKDIYFGFNTNNVVNPVERGHIAFRTDDISQFKELLETQGIPYSDYGDKAVKGWQQIFFYDPDGNVIEVHQVDHNTSQNANNNR